MEITNSTIVVLITANHTMNGVLRLLDPQDTSALLSLFSSSGHPNRLPSSIFSVALVALSADGALPDSRFTVILSKDDGGSNESTSVPVILLKERSTLVNL